MFLKCRLYRSECFALGSPFDSSQSTSVESCPPSPPDPRLKIAELSNHELSVKCLALAKAVSLRECRKCWHDHVRSGAQHFTFRCPTKILRSSHWKTFKNAVRFQTSSKICWYCFSPLMPPFSHPPNSSIGNPKQCQFPDVLKEFCYIIWEDTRTRQEVFDQLEVAMPVDLQGYAGYLIKITPQGQLGLLAVLAAYAGLQKLTV